MCVGYVGFQNEDGIARRRQPVVRVCYFRFEVVTLGFNVRNLGHPGLRYRSPG